MSGLINLNTDIHVVYPRTVSRLRTNPDPPLEVDDRLYIGFCIDSPKVR